MFDGVPDQFHQFIASSRASLPIPLSFPLHGASPAAAAPPPPSSSPPPSTFPSFDPYSVLQHVAAAHHGHHTLHHQQLHHHQLSKDTEKKEEEQQSSSNNSLLAAANLVLDRDRSIPDPPADNLPWSNDEVLTLLRIRSSLDTWFPDFTWEHVSRKLAELGFKRSAEKCKEKFEEESRHFNSLSYNNKQLRFFTELDELYHGGNADHHHHQEVLSTHEKNQNAEKQNEKKKGKEEEAGHSAEQDSNINNDEEVKKSPEKAKKRKRKYKFEMVKGFCEAIVKKIMAQQEELHNKLIEDMLKRDEEMIAREEAWKHQEMDRLNKEIEMRAKEQAIANDRQAILIDFLKKFTSPSSSSPSNSCGQDHQHDLAKRIEEFLKMATIVSSTSTSPCEIPLQDAHDTSKVSVSTQAKQDMANNSSRLLASHQLQNPSSLPTQKNPNAPSSSIETLSPQNPNSLQPTNVPNETSSSTPSLSTQNPNSAKMHENPLPRTPSSAYKISNDQREDVGKRWPRDEVLALINLRCSLINSNNNSNNNSDDSREGAKGPLWERISQGMHHLGYKRSAKRCKEKWENINKYFRKTKDNNKKRSLDSRTCPYYHQLSSLYSQGILVAPTDVQENRSPWPKNHHTISENTSIAPQSVSNDGGLHVAEGEGGNKISTSQPQGS